MISQKFFCKTCIREPIAQVLFPYFEPMRNGNVRIKRGQRLVGNGLCKRMIPEQAMRPAANDDNLREPRHEGRDESAEALKLGIVGLFRYVAIIGAVN